MKRYLVGGAVRDLLPGRLPKEWDYAFEGNTESFIQTNPGACKAGRSVSVVLLRGMEHMPLDHGVLAEDLRSRDLTINALASCAAPRHALRQRQNFRRSPPLRLLQCEALYRALTARSG